MNPSAPDDGLLGAIVRLDLSVTRVLDEIAGRAGLAFADCLVLGVVRRAPGRRSSPTAIAEVLGRTTGGMSLTLDRLETDGWLRRSRDPDDGRRVVVELTQRGLRVATRVNRELHAWESSLDLPRPPADVVAVLDAVTEVIDRRQAEDLDALSRLA
ncbi:MAG: MarR family transcriptional regulator [Acidimicrobiales bacterium]|nr:MarR family transcriptional regulator [Acidimicrobiales bacterium]